MLSTPQELVDWLGALFPEFVPHWAGPGNFFREDDGSFTFHGAFAEFSHFFRDYYEQFTEQRLTALGAFLAECMSNLGSALDNAAATCFLENVAAERFHHDFRRYLRGESLAYYSQWDDAAERA